MSEIAIQNSKRLVSLDVFRGLTIIGMIIVNTPGSWDAVFPPLQHAQWDGLTPTDLVFPFFLFVVGVSIVLAYTKQLESAAPKGKLVKKIFKRSLLIFFLGVALNLIGSDFAHLRLPGVLQRIAIVFLLASLLFLYTTRKAQMWIAAGLLLGYYFAMKYFVVPDVGQGVLLPGKNLAAWVDNLIIPFHMYQGTWDPEGVLSSFPALVTTLSGMFAAYLITDSKTKENKVLLLVIAGLSSIIVSLAWSLDFPINKNLWTSTYVLTTSGLAALSWALLIWLVDIKGYKKWGYIGLVFGSNAITAYVLSSLLLLPFTHIPMANGENLQGLFMSGLTGIGLQAEMASLLWALFFVSLCYIPVLILYRKRIFLKI